MKLFECIRVTMKPRTVELKKRRLECHLTMVDVAKAAKISTQFYREIEHGNRTCSGDVADRIVEALKS